MLEDGYSNIKDYLPNSDPIKNQIEIVETKIKALAKNGVGMSTLEIEEFRHSAYVINADNYDK